MTTDNELITNLKVAVVGCGAMGAGIAQVAAQAGHQVQLYDARPGAAQSAVDTIRANYAKLVAKRKMESVLAEEAGQRLVALSELDQVSGAGLVIEAIVENLPAKSDLFSRLEAIVSEQCILASNTSSISITSIGAGLRNPQRLVGMHFFNPVPLMALVEVISGLATDRIVAECVYMLCQSWGKKPVHTRSTPGFIVNRVARPYYAESLRIATERGASPATLDAVLRESGRFRMGPFELMDLIGNDVNFAVTSSVFSGFFNDPRFTPSLMQQELVSAGYLGRKSGRGFYQYGDHAAKPLVQIEPPCDAPREIELHADHRLANLLASKLQTATGRQDLQRIYFQNEDGVFLKCGQTFVYVTDGRSATQRSADNSVPNTVLIDLALNYDTTHHIALTKSDQCSDSAFQDAVGFFQFLGYTVSRLGDVPGMAVMRTVAMLINEASDCVNQGVCSVADVDIAMCAGVNYPIGPLAWADQIGLTTIRAVLMNLGLAYGEDRYRVSPLIHRKFVSRGKFHG